MSAFPRLVARYNQDREFILLTGTDCGEAARRNVTENMGPGWTVWMEFKSAERIDPDPRANRPAPSNDIQLNREETVRLRIELSSTPQPIDY